MKKILAAVSAMCTLFAHAQSTNSISDKRLNSLDTAFQRVLKTWKVPGFAVAVVEKNKIIYAKAFGYRDTERKLPVTPNTLFAIGSCTKAFTASLVGLLQQEGKLDIDKPAHQYNPELNFYTPELTSKVTLRDMMSHRTGLPRHDLSWYFFPSDDRDSLIRRIEFQEPTFPLAKQWQYNNFMFIAAAAVAEKVSGKSWEENLTEKILKPLEMTNTGFAVQGMENSSDASLGYVIQKDSFTMAVPYYHIGGGAPAGAINSNVMDMSKWLMAWIHNGNYNGKEILSPAFSTQAISSQSIIQAALPTVKKPGIYFANYGFGWFLTSYKGHYSVEHGGAIDGFTASVCFFPTDSIGIVVLCNQDGSPVPPVVRNLISDRLLGQAYYNWNDDIRASYKKSMEASGSRVSSQVQGTQPSHPLADFEGLYSNAGYGTFDVFVRNDSLYASTPNRLIYLKHYHYDVFVPAPLNDYRFTNFAENDFRFQFNTGVNGDIESFNAIGIESPTIQLVFKKTPKEKRMSGGELSDYEGVFTIGGMEIKIFPKGDNLHMLVPGQTEYELLASGNDKFLLKNINGFAVQFLRDEKGLINAINLIQPNGTFKADKKK